MLQVNYVLWYGHCDKSAVRRTPPVASRVLELTGVPSVKQTITFPYISPRYKLNTKVITHQSAENHADHSISL